MISRKKGSDVPTELSSDDIFIFHMMGAHNVPSTVLAMKKQGCSQTTENALSNLTYITSLKGVTR